MDSEMDRQTEKKDRETDRKIDKLRDTQIEIVLLALLV